MVPHFKRLSDFMLAKKWYMRALYMPGPERSDTELRMRRHGFTEEVQRGLSYIQIRFKPVKKPHIRCTSEAHKL